MSNVDSTLSVIRRRTDLCPLLGIVLGSGLGGIVDFMADSIAIDFSELPGFGTSTVAGHRGQLVLGRLSGVPIVAMAGRLHRYGGWTTGQVTFPIAVMQGLGATQLIVSNAAGGVNPKYRVGDIVVIQDHLDWMYGRPPLRFDPPQPVSPIDAPRRSDAIYDPLMTQLALRAARRGRFAAHRGTYLGTLGPNYETRAEYRMMRILGADVVGMSTVPEVLTASRLGMRVLALSVVSNVASPDAPKVASHDEVLAAGNQAEIRMRQIVEAVIAETGNLAAGNYAAGIEHESDC